MKASPIVSQEIDEWNSDVVELTGSNSADLLELGNGRGRQDRMQ
jgi:hypothetical protein